MLTRFGAFPVKAVVSAVVACLFSFAAAAVSGELAAAGEPVQLDLRLPDMDGRDRDLGEFRGRVILVNFWASWCAPCLTEMPSIQRLDAQMRGKPFSVIGVNVAEPTSRVRRVVARLGIEFTVLLDRDGTLFNRWGAVGLPTTYVLDGEGSVRYVGRGPLEWDGPDVMAVLDGLIEGENAAGQAAGVKAPTAD